jgi:hypothetical protein
MGAMCTQVLPLAEIGAAGDREACRKVYLRPSFFKARVLSFRNIVIP